MLKYEEEKNMYRNWVTTHIITWSDFEFWPWCIAIPLGLPPALYPYKTYKPSIFNHSFLLFIWNRQFQKFKTLSSYHNNNTKNRTHTFHVNTVDFLSFYLFLWAKMHFKFHRSVLSFLKLLVSCTKQASTIINK